MDALDDLFVIAGDHNLLLLPYAEWLSRNAVVAVEVNLDPLLNAVLELLTPAPQALLASFFLVPVLGRVQAQLKTKVSLLVRLQRQLER